MRIIQTVTALVVLLPVAAAVVSCVGYPPEEDLSPLPEDGAQAEETGEASDEIFKNVKCRKEDRGVTCMVLCVEESLFCPGGQSHPYSPSSGTGLLWKCDQKGGATRCWYYWNNGDVCQIIVNKDPICKYEGGID